MPRTTDAAVKQILKTELNTMPFIMTASTLVTAYLGSAGLSEPHLSEIECWWAAHLTTIQEPLVQRTRLGESEVSFVDLKGTLAKGLESTPYGQTVLMLDSSGTLVSLGAQAEAGLKRATFDVD
jgi:hypothetical protein